MMDGILAVNKEEGYTSHDVVAVLRKLLHIRRIGHTGTLDPMATGVLPVAIGQGTRLVELLTEKRKTYRAVLRLGITTDTQDRTGTVLSEKPVLCTEEMVIDAAASFTGEQMQIPPMYSAIKVQGKRLYDLAREGITVERDPRKVVFYEIRVEKTDLPFVTLLVSCSKGTYIRTLCHDIGQKLGCGGCMESLVRLSSGDFRLEDCHTLSEIRQAVEEGTIENLIRTPEQVLAHCPALYSDGRADKLLWNGNPVPAAFFSTQNKDEQVRVYISDGTFAGLYKWDPAKEKYHPVRIFLPCRD